MPIVPESSSAATLQQEPQQQQQQVQQDQRTEQHSQPTDFYGAAVNAESLVAQARAENAHLSEDGPCQITFTKIPSPIRNFMMMFLGFENFMTDLAFHRPRFAATQAILSMQKDQADFPGDGNDKYHMRRWSCAVRCNARYTNSNAAYFCERAYVRDLIVRASHTFFYRALDGNPLFFIMGISQRSKGRKPWREIRAGIHNVNATTTAERIPPTAEDASGRIYFKHAESTGRSIPAHHFANARTTVVFNGAPGPMSLVRDALQKLSDDLDEKKRQEVLGDETSEPARRRARSQTEGTSAGAGEVTDAASEAALRAMREQVHAREVFCHEQGNIKIAAYLTMSEATEFAKQHNVCVMPLQYIENYEDADELLNLSLRYRRRVDVLQENESLVKIQHAIPGAFTFYTSYTTVRVRLPHTITPEDINTIRGIVGGDNTTLNIIPDSPAIAPEPAARVSPSVADPNRKSAWKKVPSEVRPQKTEQKRFLVFDAALPIEVVDLICQDEKVTRIANLTQDYECSCNTFVVQWNTTDGTPQPDESGHGTARVIEFAGREVVYMISKQRKPQYE